MNINTAVRAFESASENSASQNVLYEYDFCCRGTIIGLVVRDPEKGTHQAEILKISAARTARICCQSDLYEVGTLVKFIDYLTWNNRPCLMLTSRGSAFHAAVQQLHQHSSANMSSQHKCIEGCGLIEFKGIRSVIAFVDDDVFVESFHGIELPRSGALIHVKSSNTTHRLRDRVDCSIHDLTINIHHQSEVLSCLTWGVDR